MFTSLRTHLTPTLVATLSVLVLGAAAAGADAATAPAQVTVPPIHESFTHQACPAQASTTVALEDCAGDRVLSLDQRIDRLDIAILAELPAAGQAQFATAAKRWLSYRNEVAQAAASPSSGGTIQPLEELEALQTEDRAHITALTQEFTSATGQRP